MKVTPKSETECTAFPILTPGWYEAVVETAEDKTSKAGNEMIEIRLRIYGPDNTRPGVYDYLMDKVAYKLRHFCDASGVLDLYEAGSVSARDCADRRVGVLLEIEDSTQHGRKNKVKDYRKIDGASEPKADMPADDDIPF